MTSDEILIAMADRWPSAIVARQEVPRFSGGLLSVSKVKRLEDRIPKYRMGRKVFYAVTDLIELIAQESVTEGPAPSGEDMERQLIKRRGHE